MASDEDVLTFESVATATGDLTPEVPANYQVQQPGGTFLQPKYPGTFRFRIPRALYANPPPATDHSIANDGESEFACISVQSPPVAVAELFGDTLAEVNGYDDEDD